MPLCQADTFSRAAAWPFGFQPRLASQAFRTQASGMPGAGGRVVRCRSPAIRAAEPEALPRLSPRLMQAGRRIYLVGPCSWLAHDRRPLGGSLMKSEAARLLARSDANEAARSSHRYRPPALRASRGRRRDRIR